MNIEYTKHLEQQIEERKIHKVWVNETIKSPDDLKRDGHKFYAVKKLNGKVLKVVFVKEKHIKVLLPFL